MVVALAALSLNKSRAAVDDMARSSVYYLSMSLSRELGDALSQTDLVLEQISDAVQSQRAQPPGALPLDKLKARLRFVDALAIFDGSGALVAESTPIQNSIATPAPEAWLEPLRRDERTEWVLSRPYLSPYNNQWGVLLARRRGGPGPAFHGAVVAYVPLSRIEELFVSLKLSNKGSIGLRDADLRLIVRHPALGKGAAPGDTKVATDFREALERNRDGGMYTAGATSIDGIRRLHSYQRNARFGFYLNVGFAEDDYLSSWRQHARLTWLVVGLFCGASLLLGVYLRYSISRLRGVEEELRAHKDNLEDMVHARTVALEHASAALRKAMDQAVAADRAKSEFLANMSHEIRTPIHAMMGLSALLEGEPLLPAQHHSVSLVRRAAESLLTLVNDVLDLSRIEAGRINLVREPVELRALMKELQQLLEPEAATAGLSLECQVEDSVPSGFWGDTTRLRQVLINLMGNGIKFTDSGSVRVLAHANDAKLYVEVTDTGIGIDASRREDIFDAFSQVDPSARRTRSGAGLGLAICKRLVERMGGTLDVRSEPGKGSTFTVAIPLEPAELPPAPARASSRPPQRPLTVLVAEDSPVNMLVARRMLDKLGHGFLSATNGREAIRLLAEREVDVVLMDVQMPELDGVEATRELRRSGFRVPIVAVTANAMARDRENCLEAGMNDFLSKPYTLSQLEALLRKWNSQQAENGARSNERTDDFCAPSEERRKQAD